MRNPWKRLVSLYQQKLEFFFKFHNNVTNTSSLPAEVRSADCLSEIICIHLDRTAVFLVCNLVALTLLKLVLHRGDAGLTYFTCFQVHEKCLSW